MRDVAESLRGLASDEPSRRLEARGELLAYGQQARNALDAALLTVDSLSDPLAQEITRIRDWIDFGVDPQQLAEWFGELDLRTRRHENMLNGMVGAIVTQPAFKKLSDRGERIRSFLEARVSDAKEAFSLRTAAALLLGRLQIAGPAPVLIAAYREQFEQLSATGQDTVNLPQDYRGLFLVTLHAAIQSLTNHGATSAAAENIWGVYQRGKPSTFYVPRVAEQALKRWQQWLDHSQTAKEAEVPHKGAGVIARLFRRRQADLSLDDCEQVLRGTRDDSLGDTGAMAEVFRQLLIRAGEVLILRDLILLAHARNATALFRALPQVVELSPLAENYPLSCFNPYAFLGWSQPAALHSVSATVLDAIAAGLHTQNSRSRELFQDVASTIATQSDSKKTVSRKLLERLDRLQGQFVSVSERADLMDVGYRLGRPPEIAELLALAQQSLTAGDSAILAKLFELLSVQEIPALKREDAKAVLLRAADAHAEISTSILRALSTVDPENFDFNPKIGASGLKGLITLRRLLPLSSKDDAEKVEIAIRELRDDLMSRLEPGSLESQFIDSGLDICVKAAEQCDLYSVLYDCLVARSSVLGIGLAVTTELTAASANERNSLFEGAYFKSLGELSAYTSFDISAALAGRAADIAAQHDLATDRMLFARLLEADMARKAGRFPQAEQLFCAFAETVPDSPDQLLTARHYHTLLLLQQRRWADALDITLEAAAAAKNLPQLSDEQKHLAADASLYEGLCRRALGEVSRAAAIFNQILEVYRELGIALHYAQVLVELAGIEGHRGDESPAEQLFQQALQIVVDRPGQDLAIAHVLSRGAEQKMRTGQLQAAEEMLRHAITLQEAERSSPFEGFDTQAENRWRLGRVLLAQGKGPDITEPLSHLETAAAYDPISAAYAIRLRASLQMYQGATAAAAVTLRDGLLSVQGAIYPELQVELALDLHRLLLASGFGREAEQTLTRAEPGTLAAQNPVLRDRLQMARARGLEQTGGLPAATELYRQIVSGETDEANPSDAWRAASVSYDLLVADVAGLAEPAAASLLAQIDRIWDTKTRLEQLCRYAAFCVTHRLDSLVPAATERIDSAVREGSSLDVLLDVVQLRGTIAEFDGRPDEARAHFNRAVHLVEVMRSSSLESGTIGSGYLRSVIAPYRSLIANLVAVGETSQALHFVERAKSRFLLEQMHWRGSAKSDTLDTDAADAARRYLDAFRRLAVLEAGGAGEAASEEVKQLQQQLAALKPRITDEELAAVLFPLLGDSGETWTKLTEYLREEASENGSGKRLLLVEYFVMDHVTLVFAMREDWDRPKFAAVQRNFEELRSYIASSFSLDDRAGASGLNHSRVRHLDTEDFQQRFAPFIEPILEWSEPDDYVYLIPHDVLHYVPLHALRAGPRLLAERNPVLYVPSASILRTCRAKRKNRRRDIAIFGDSDLAHPLPYARAEAIRIGNLFHERPHLGQDATKTCVLQRIQSSVDRLDILHFACHGIFHPEQALKSGILLAPESDRVENEAGGAPAGLPQSRFLTAEDFFQIEMRTDLVVLSACESGVNELQPGDELFGLMRAIVYAGAPSLLMSLWSVGDASTGILMQRFYEALENGANKAEALRSAQAALRKMNGTEVIAFCDDTVHRLETSGHTGAAKQIRRDIGDLYYSMRDYVAARAIFEVLLADPEATAPEQGLLQGAIARCRRLEGMHLPPDPMARVFDHPFSWAPFVLIGDYK